MPLVWVPYFYYPDPTVKRRSGFLTPEYSHSDDLGFSAGVPYYYSLSPSADLTVTPVRDDGSGISAQGGLAPAAGQWQLPYRGRRRF